MLIVWGFVALVCGFAGMMILEPQQDGGTGFALGFFLGPLGLVIAFVMRANTPATAPRQGERKCPACAEMVKAEAIKCRFCGEALTPVVPVAQPVAAPMIPAEPDNGMKIGLALTGVLIVLVAVVIFIQSERAATNDVPSPPAAASTVP